MWKFSVHLDINESLVGHVIKKCHPNIWFFLAFLNDLKPINKIGPIGNIGNNYWLSSWVRFIQMRGRVNEPFESNKKVNIQVLYEEFIRNIELTQQLLFCYWLLPNVRQKHFPCPECWHPPLPFQLAPHICQRHHTVWRVPNQIDCNQAAELGCCIVDAVGHGAVLGIAYSP